jgi:hypothetical protein
MHARQVAAGEHVRRLAKRDAVHCLNEVEYVARGLAAEAIIALAAVEDRERWAAIFMQRAARLKLVAGSVEFDHTTHDTGQRMVAADRIEIEEGRHVAISPSRSRSMRSSQCAGGWIAGPLRKP